MGLIQMMRERVAERAAKQNDERLTAEQAYWQAVQTAAADDGRTKPKAADVERLEALIARAGRSLEDFASHAGAVQDQLAADAAAASTRSDAAIQKGAAAAAKKLIEHDQARAEFLAKWDRDRVALLRNRNDADREHKAACDARHRAAVLRAKVAAMKGEPAPDVPSSTWTLLPAQPGDVTGGAAALQQAVFERRRALKAHAAGGKGATLSADRLATVTEELATFEFALARAEQRLARPLDGKAGAADRRALDASREIDVARRHRHLQQLEDDMRTGRVPRDNGLLERERMLIKQLEARLSESSATVAAADGAVAAAAAEDAKPSGLDAELAALRRAHSRAVELGRAQEVENLEQQMGELQQERASRTAAGGAGR